MRCVTSIFRPMSSGSTQTTLCRLFQTSTSLSSSSSSGPSSSPASAPSRIADAAAAATVLAEVSSSSLPDAERKKQNELPPQKKPKEQAAVPSPYKLTPDHVKRAFKRISQTVTRTPLDFSPRLSKLLPGDTQLYLKKEHYTITGSYKERGALNKLLQLTEEERRRGVICSSAGNHAQAVSYHSTRLGIDGVIVMPVTTPYVKVNSTREFGAKVVLAGESFAEAYDHAVKIAKEEGRTFIHAFNDPEVVAGQGTCAMELLEQNPYMDAVIVPVGGGGLIAGMSLLLKAVNPRIQIYGVESVAMPGMYNSLKSGKLQSVPKKPSMADGIAIEHVGAIPFEVIKQNVDDIVLVEEDEIASAILLMLEKERTVLEGSGATGIAAIMSGKLPQLAGKNVVTICTGGNIDMSLLGRVIEKGLVKTGRLARIHVTILDQPGQLARVLGIFRDMRANIRDIEHERAFLLANVGMTQPIVTVETRGFDHVQEIVAKLRAEGFDSTYLETPVS